MRVTVPLSEYLDSVYRPDREYVDGELLERNVGDLDHSRSQMLMSRYLSNRENEWGIIVLPQQRVQVKATRFRVPDITVIAGPLPSTPILRQPPFLCIEILFRDDSMDDMQESAKGAAASSQTAKELVRTSGGEPDTTPVLRAFLQRIDDYLAFGVPHVSVVNPRKSRAFHYSLDGMREAKDGILRTSNPDIVVPILDLESNQSRTR